MHRSAPVRQLVTRRCRAGDEGVGMKKAWGATAVAVAAGLMWAAVPGAAQAAERTIVPSRDFVTALQRHEGHRAVRGGRVRAGHLHRRGRRSTDKVAEYVAVGVPLAGVGEPSLDYMNTAAAGPGLPARRGLRRDGVGRRHPDRRARLYGNDWWASNGVQAVRQGRRAVSRRRFRQPEPRDARRSGGRASPTRRCWPSASRWARGSRATASLNAINFAGDRYTFSDKVPDTHRADA